MKKRILAIVAALLIPTAAMAQIRTNAQPIASGYMLSAAALNATQTINVPIAKNWAKMRLGVAYTYSAATSVTLTPYCSYDGTTFYQLITRSCTSGACERNPMTDVETGTASWTGEFEYDVRGCETFRVQFTSASGDGSDVVTTQAIAIVGD